jgi:hypothetical protein
MENYTNDTSFVVGYRISTAETAIGDMLDLLTNPKITREEMFEIIDALGEMVGEINAQVNGYFDDHGENCYFRDFIR